MLIIGTAGHIDHGKSAIVKRLTGTDPDRLPEEKSRGMTIDLGFAFYKTPAGDTIAFVDVPGHERFVKNMVAGVGGIDVIMLVVAADDGWMPQSEEHFQIVKLLNIKQGLIVINKVDLADDEWLELLEVDIRDKVKNSFLEEAPIFRLSAQTGEGFDDIKRYFNEIIEDNVHHKDINKPRLYIDRSFVRAGIGGVVTGTLRGGQVSTGQVVGLWPSMIEAKIRTLHSNNLDVETAVPGQRTAVSFTGVDKQHLIRGGVVVDPSSMSYLAENNVHALSIELLDNLNLTLNDRRRILLIVGTTEVEGEIRLYDNKQIKPGEKGVVFFKPDEPLYSLIGDRFIARLPTPMITIGGGVVLDHLKHFPRQKSYDKYDYLLIRRELKIEDLIISELKKKNIVSGEKLLQYSNFSYDNIEEAVKRLWHKKVIEIFEGCFYHVEYFEKTVSGFVAVLERYLDKNSHLKGLSFEQLCDLSKWDDKQAEIIIKYLVSNGQLVALKDKYNLIGRGMSLKGALKKAYDDIMAELNENRYAPPLLSKIANRGKQYKDAVKFIIDVGQGYKCGTDFIFLIDVWEEIVQFIKETLNEKGQINVADLREKFDFSRKFCIPIFEETDRIKLTRRDGDIRIKGADFEKEKFDI